MTKYANILMSYSHSLRGSTTSNYTATRVVGKLTDIRINPHNKLSVSLSVNMAAHSFHVFFV